MKKTTYAILILFLACTVITLTNCAEHTFDEAKPEEIYQQAQNTLERSLGVADEEPQSAEPNDENLNAIDESDIVNEEPQNTSENVEITHTLNESDIEKTERIYGNTAGNIANGGYVAVNKGRVFYSLYGMNLYSINVDGSDKRILDEIDGRGGASYINVIGDCIYYVRRYKTEQFIQSSNSYRNDWVSRIYSMKKDGSDKMRLSDDDEVTSIHVVDDRIYFSTIGNGIFSMKTDGSDRVQLSDYGSHIIYMMGDRIYCGMDSYRPDGTDNKVLNLDEINMVLDYFIITEDRLFFINKDDDYTLYSINLDGSDKKKICDDRFWNEQDSVLLRRLNILEDIIYFTAGASFPSRMNLDGSNWKLLNDSVQSSLIYATEDYISSILCDMITDDVFLYIMNPDGSDFRLLDYWLSGVVAP